MGQSVSTKKHQGLTFGYVNHRTDNTSSTVTVTAITTTATTTDLLLDRPEYYGLSTATNNSSNNCHSNSNEPEPVPTSQQQRRPDSGYVEDDRLVKELAYVDTTYYLDTMLPSSSGSSRSPSKEPTSLKSGIDKNNNDDENTSDHQQKKLTFKDIVPKDGSGGSMQELHLPCRYLTSLSCTNLYHLTMVQKLDLSRNHLTHLPDAIGSLINLTTLQLAHNQLVEIPDTICGLINLTDLDLGHNRLTRVSPHIGHLKKLAHLNLNHNRSLSELPIEVGGLESLASLSVLHCPEINMLPAELLQLPNLRRLKIASVSKKDNNNATSEEEQLHIMNDLKHDPPSLLEICARRNIKEAAYYLPHVQPKPCTACGKPYFQSYVSRRRLVERPDLTLVMFEYRLCSAHWTDDDDRMRYIFSQSPSLSSKDSNSSVLKFLPPIVDLHPNHHHQKQQQHLQHLYHHHSERSNSNSSSNNSSSTSSMGPPYNNSTTIEEEKVATTSRWRPQRFLRAIKH